MMHMVFWNQIKSNNIVDVAINKDKPSQNLIHNPLKLCRGVFVCGGINNLSHYNQPQNVIIIVCLPSMTIDGSLNKNPKC
jgi:hypothetical protein